MVNNCFSCGREFDCAEIACFSGSRGPSYDYCACDSCRKAWLVGTFEMFGKFEVRETEYIKNDVLVK